MTRRPGEYADEKQLADEEKLAQTLLDEQATPETKQESKTEGASPAKPETWEDRVKAAGLTMDQALEILDAMIEKGFYEKTIPLYAGRRPVVLRTRDAYCRQRVANALDTLRTNDPRVHSQTTLRICLAGSLVQFGKKALAFASPDADIDAQETAFNARLKFVDSLGDPFLDTLYATLGEFDKWTYAALSNGAPTGF